MDASCKIQRSIHDVRLTYKYVSRILGTYQSWTVIFYPKKSKNRIIRINTGILSNMKQKIKEFYH